jgi:hypothetical protein
MPTIESLRKSPLFQVLAAPVHKSVQDLHNVFSTHTDVGQSLTRLFFTIGFFALGLCMAYLWFPGMATTVESFWIAVNMPTYTIQALTAYTSGWLVSYPGGEIAAQGLRVSNYCRFGDYDYFLCESEKKTIAEKICKLDHLEQSDVNSQRIMDEIQDVVDFCVEKIRSSDEAVRDMADVYKRIFHELRKGNLAKYYEHKTMMLAQSEKMAEAARAGKKRAERIQRRINAIEQGLDYDSSAESDNDEIENIEDNSPMEITAGSRSLEPLAMIESNILSEIKRLQVTVDSSQALSSGALNLRAHFDEQSATVSKVNILSKQKDMWSEHLSVLIHKEEILQSSLIEIRARLNISTKRLSYLQENPVEEGDRVTTYRRILDEALRDEKEQKIQTEKIATLTHELEVVKREIAEDVDRIDVLKKEISGREVEIDQIMSSQVEEKYKVADSLATKAEEINVIEIIELEIELENSKTEILFFSKKLKELRVMLNRPDDYDVETARRDDVEIASIDDVEIARRDDDFIAPDKGIELYRMPSHLEADDEEKKRLLKQKIRKEISELEVKLLELENKHRVLELKGREYRQNREGSLIECLKLNKEIMYLSIGVHHLRVEASTLVEHSTRRMDRSLERTIGPTSSPRSLSVEASSGSSSRSRVRSKRVKSISTTPYYTQYMQRQGAGAETLVMSNASVMAPNERTAAIKALQKEKRKVEKHYKQADKVMRSIHY